MFLWEGLESEQAYQGCISLRPSFVYMVQLSSLLKFVCVCVCVSSFYLLFGFSLPTTTSLNLSVPVFMFPCLLWLLSLDVSFMYEVSVSRSVPLGNLALFVRRLLFYCMSLLMFPSCVEVGVGGISTVYVLNSVGDGTVPCGTLLSNGSFGVAAEIRSR